MKAQGNNMKKMILPLLVWTAALFGSEIEFAGNGRTQYVIAVPEKPAGFDRRAAEDLRY